jgi:hypothetical protein
VTPHVKPDQPGESATELAAARHPPLPGAIISLAAGAARFVSDLRNATEAAAS